MTIDESINQIIESLLGNKANLLNYYDRVALTDALNTMRKYQKIEQIIKDWEDGRFSDGVGCLRVKVVLEDGNSDMDNSDM